MAFSFTTRGGFDSTEKFLREAARGDLTKILDKHGVSGVKALSRATPRDTGETADAWDYTIQKTRSGYEIVWTNSHVNDGVNIAIILQYGHGTRTGGYVRGRDYINPAAQPVFDRIVEEIMREVS